MKPDDRDQSLRDPAQYHEASQPFDFSVLDSLEDTVAELIATGGPAAVADFIRERDSADGGLTHEKVRLIGAMFFAAAAQPPRLFGLAVALDLDTVRQMSYEQIGDTCGVTKAAISKEAIQWLKLLGSPPPPRMKSEAARASYRRVRLQATTPAKISG